MSALSIQIPFPVFQGRDGQPLKNGYIWIGEPNLNPQTNPVVAYYDAALTIVAPQPLRTLNGYVSRAGTPAQIYVDGVNFSILVQDSKGSMVYNFPEGTGISPDASGVAFTGFKGQIGFVSDLADDDGSDWTGFLQAGTGAVAVSAQDKMRQTVSVKDFGAVGDGVTDDTAAIQAAINYIATLIVATSPALPGSQIATYGELIFESKQYFIGSSLAIPSKILVNGNGCVLTAPNNGTIFTSTAAYRVIFDNIIFNGNNVAAVNFNIPNLDNSKYEFNNCEFGIHTRTAGVFAVRIKSRSAAVYFNECDVQAAPNFLYVESDFCEINGGWINGYSGLNPVPNTKQANSASIENRSSLRIKNTIFIPEADGVVRQEKVRWIDNHFGSISIQGCHFGGENAGFPIIYQFVTGAITTAPFLKYAAIRVENSTINSGSETNINRGVVVLQPGVIPGRYSFNSNESFIAGLLINSIGYDFTKTIAETDELLRTQLNSSINRTWLDQIDIQIFGISRPGTIPPCLQPFVKPLSYYGRNRSPVDSVQYPIAYGRMVAAQAGATNSSVSADAIITVTGEASGRPYTQVKKYPIDIVFHRGNTAFVRIGTPTFYEYAPLGLSVGDVIISLAVVGTSTSSTATLGVTLAAGLINSGVAWRFENVVESGNGNPLGLFVTSY